MQIIAETSQNVSKIGVFSASTARAKRTLTPREAKPRNRTKAQHSLEVWNLCLSAVGYPENCRDLSDALFILAEDESAEAPIAITDARLASAIACAGMQGDLTATRIALRRIRHQRPIVAAHCAALDATGLKNPTTIKIEREYDPIKKKLHYHYTLPILRLYRAVMATCSPSTSQKALKACVSAEAKEFIWAARGEKYDAPKRKAQTDESKISRGFGYLGKGVGGLAMRYDPRTVAERICDKMPVEILPFLADAISLKLRTINSLAEAPSNKFGTGSDDEYGVIDGRESAELDTFPIPIKNVSNMKPQTPPAPLTDSHVHAVPSSLPAPPYPRLVPPIGQDVEDFIASNPAYAGADQPVIDWRDLPASDRQRRYLAMFGQAATDLTRAAASALIDELKINGTEPLATDAQCDLLARGGVIDPSLTIGQASARIQELLAAGALIPDNWFSLAELERFDGKARGFGKRQRRFCCPDCHGDKRMDADHRSLAVNVETGEYYCHRCQTAGVLREFCAANASPVVREFPAPQPAKQETDDRWRKFVADAKPITGTVGAQYLDGRGVPADVAESAGVLSGTWWKRDDVADKPVPFSAVIFPICDQTGVLVAAQARAIAGDTKRTRGDKSQGVFLATPGALAAQRLSITEAPIDALTVAACGVDAIALAGTSWPEWLPAALAGKQVLVATDNDQAGDECFGRIADALDGLADVVRVRPNGAKDWTELAERYGLDTVEAQLAFELGEFDGSDEMHESPLITGIPDAHPITIGGYQTPPKVLGQTVEVTR